MSTAHMTQRRAGNMAMASPRIDEDQSHEPELKTRIEHTLDELRVVLPGTQALLGFQFVACFQNQFADMGRDLRYAHMISLGLVIVTTMLLMWPAAYHRLVRGGRDSEDFHAFASAVLVLALAALAAGLSLDLYVVAGVVMESQVVAALVGVVCVVTFYGCWFGSALVRKRTREGGA